MASPTEARIAGLDGLRALSVLIVFLHHTGLAPLHGGWVGVDLFFVLSGYLITGILVREYSERGSIDLRRFYARRAWRLFPALAGLLLAVGLYLFLVGPLLDPFMELVPALFYVMNWVRAFELHDAVLTGHTWSLAIEEQYYLLWPILLGALLAGPQGRRRAIAVLAILIALTLIWRWQVASLRQIDGSSPRIIYGFDTHADGLLVGGLIALVPHRVRTVLAYAWLVALVYFAWIVLSPTGDATGLTVGGYTLTSWAGGILIAKIATDQNGLLVRALEARPLVLLGMVSYGFYLWHYPVVQIVLYGNIDEIGAFFGSLPFPRVSMLVTTFALSLVLTMASWFAIEKPLLKARS